MISVYMGYMFSCTVFCASFFSFSALLAKIKVYGAGHNKSFCIRIPICTKLGVKTVCQIVYCSASGGSDAISQFFGISPRSRPPNFPPLDSSDDFHPLGSVTMASKAPTSENLKCGPYAPALSQADNLKPFTT